jgi:hypothetical protein
VRLSAFAIVAEERGFLKLLWRSFCGRSLLLSGRVIQLDGDSLILEPHSSGHHVPLSYCAYGSISSPLAIEPLGAATWYALGWRAAKVAIGRSRTCLVTK